MTSKLIKAALRNVHSYPSYTVIFFVFFMSAQPIDWLQWNKFYEQRSKLKLIIFLVFIFWKCFLMTLGINHLFLKPTQGKLFFKLLHGLKQNELHMPMLPTQSNVLNWNWLTSVAQFLDLKPNSATQTASLGLQTWAFNKLNGRHAEHIGPLWFLTLPFLCHSPSFCNTPCRLIKKTNKKKHYNKLNFVPLHQ